MLIPDLRQAKYGDIILFRPTGMISQLQTKIDSIGQEPQNFSHGAIFLENIGDIGIMVESVNKGGVRIAPIQEWRNYVIVRPEGSYRIVPKKSLISKVRSDYDFNKILRVMFSRLFGVSLSADDDKKLICTELINYAYRYQLTEKGMCTPVTLANAILK